MSWLSKLYDEQRPVLDFVMSRPGTLLLGDTGTGKTYITLATIERMALEAIGSLNVLLVVPLTSLDVVWTPKLISFTEHENALLRFEVLRSPDQLPRRTQSASVSSQAPLERRILLLHMQDFSKYSRKLAKKPWDLVVIDESQVLKARNSGFSRAARRLRNSGRRLALSATPIDKTPIDLFGQMRFVDHTIFGEDFGPFANEYTRPGGWKGKKKVFRQSKMAKFKQKLGTAMVQLSKAFLNLPPMTIIPVPTQLLGSQARLYDQIKHHSVSAEPMITARLAVTRQVKLEQITGGLVIDDNGTSQLVGHAKERKLKSLLGRITDRPVVVFCKYIHEIPLIKNALREIGIRATELHGGITGKERTNLILNFQDGLIPALVCQVRTGGVSIELTRSNTLIFYSFGFSMIDFEQILGRVNRGGQTRPMTVYVMHAVNTVDDEIIEAIEEKYTIFDEITFVDNGQSSNIRDERRIVVTA